MPLSIPPRRQHGEIFRKVSVVDHSGYHQKKSTNRTSVLRSLASLRVGVVRTRQPADYLGGSKRAPQNHPTLTRNSYRSEEPSRHQRGPHALSGVCASIGIGGKPLTRPHSRSRTR